MSNDFLPRGYEVPKTQGNYFKFEKGENRFRVMSSAIVGYLYWTNENKPIRSRTPFKSVPADARMDDGKFKPKHFWAFLVWNYEMEKLQILELTQTTIMASVEALVSNPKWGDPKGFDIVVKATGDGLEREYSTVPEPHTAAPNADTSNVFLDALYRGEDPFNSTTSDGTPVPNFNNPPAGEVTAEDFPEHIID